MRKKKDLTLKELESQKKEIQAQIKAKKAELQRDKPKVKKPKYPKSGFVIKSEINHMFVNDIRILTPKEYEALKDAIPKKKHKYMFDMLMITGMRYIEYLRFFEHQDWYNKKKNLIHLPEEAVEKGERKMPERNIRPLPKSYFEVLMDNFDEKPPLQDTWSKNLKRWAIKAGIDPYGISAKTTRKTSESWMIAAGIDESKVCLRQGHDVLTSMKHYQGLALDDELTDIIKQLEEWNIIQRQTRLVSVLSPLEAQD